MKKSVYESHNLYLNKDFPIIFHKDSNHNWDVAHWHENLELIFVTEGEFEVHLDNRVYHIRKGDILVINSSVIHKFLMDSGDTVYYCLIVGKEFCEQFGFFVDENYIHEKVDAPELFDFAEKIHSLMAEKSEYYEAEVMSQVLNILLSLFRKHIDNHAEYKKNKSIDMVKAGIKYIGKHFNEPMGMSDVAEAIGYSKYHFSRCFKEITGSTVNEHINRVRINAAITLLEKGMSVTEAAAECGFSDISYFTKIFKRYTGMLPSRIEKDKMGM